MAPPAQFRIPFKTLEKLDRSFLTLDALLNLFKRVVKNIKIVLVYLLKLFSYVLEKQYNLKELSSKFGSLSKEGVGSLPKNPREVMNTINYLLGILHFVIEHLSKSEVKLDELFGFDIVKQLEMHYNFFIGLDGALIKKELIDPKMLENELNSISMTLAKLGEFYKELDKKNKEVINKLISQIYVPSLWRNFFYLFVPQNLYRHFSQAIIKLSIIQNIFKNETDLQKRKNNFISLIERRKIVFNNSYKQSLEHLFKNMKDFKIFLEILMELTRTDNFKISKKNTESGELYSFPQGRGKSGYRFLFRITNDTFEFLFFGPHHKYENILQKAA